MKLIGFEIHMDHSKWELYFPASEERKARKYVQEIYGLRSKRAFIKDEGLPNEVKDAEWNHRVMRKHYSMYNGLSLNKIN